MMESYNLATGSTGAVYLVVINALNTDWPNRRQPLSLARIFRRTLTLADIISIPRNELRPSSTVWGNQSFRNYMQIDDIAWIQLGTIVMGLAHPPLANIPRTFVH